MMKGCAVMKIRLDLLESHKVPKKIFKEKNINVKKSFKGRMAQLLNVSESKVTEILQPSKVFTCRLNRLRKVNREQIIEKASKLGIDMEPLSWYPDAFVVKNTKYDLLKTDLVKGGVLYIQNASSYLPVLALEPSANEKILDACAAPGGKTSHIAALTDGKADIWANDGIKIRLESFKQVQKLLGFKTSRLTCIPAQSLDKEIKEQFDKILLDVQCSGEGMIDINNLSTMRFWSLERITKYMHLQTKALNACFNLLKPGGVLVYSTCTYAPEENEAPISKFLKRHKDAFIQPLQFDSKYVRHGVTKWQDMVFDEQLRGALRVLPHDGMEGFFVCRIVKKMDQDEKTVLDLKAVGQKYAGLKGE